SLSAIVERLFSLDAVYIVTGIVLFVFAWFTWTDRGNRRRTSAIFWAILGIIFAFGTWMPHSLTGVLVLGMVVMDGANRVAPGSVREPTNEEQRAGADRLRHRIFVPVLTIPLVTVVFALVAARLGSDVTRAALVGLGLGGIVAMFVCLTITGGGMRTMMEHGRRLNDAIGAVTILPQLLASLGVIFAAAKVGDLIAGAIQHIIPPGRLFLLVMANCLGMALFSIVMGNSFAAFPVI